MIPLPPLLPSLHSGLDRGKPLPPSQTPTPPTTPPSPSPSASPPLVLHSKRGSKRLNPSPADSTSSLEAPTLEDVSSSSDEDSGGDIWGMPPSGGVGEDHV